MLYHCKHLQYIDLDTMMLPIYVAGVLSLVSVLNIGNVEIDVQYLVHNCLQGGRGRRYLSSQSCAIKSDSRL